MNPSRNTNVSIPSPTRVLAALAGPLDEQHVALEDLRRHVPLGVGDVVEQLRERLADPSLPRSTPLGVMNTASSA